MTHPNQQPDPSNRELDETPRRTLGAAALDRSFNGAGPLIAERQFNAAHPPTSDEHFYGQVATLSGREQMPFSD